LSPEESAYLVVDLSAWHHKVSNQNNIVYSRDEMKQLEMAKECNGSSTQLFIGDVRDKYRLQLAHQGIDYIVRVAAI